MTVAAAFVFVWVGWLIGWCHAHQTVAKECRTLGGFFVGKTTFKCSAEEPRE